MTSLTHPLMRSTRPTLSYRIAMAFALLCALLIAMPAQAAFPALTGRVVDGANIISAPAEAELTTRLAALEAETQRQLVVATVPDLGGNDVADYGYRLGRAWGIGDDERNDGVILLIAPNERRVHIAVGYGLEPVVTDAFAASTIRNAITPPFREGNYDAGIIAGVSALSAQMRLTPEEAAAMAERATAEEEANDGSGLALFIFIIFLLFFVVLPILRALGGGRRYRSRRRDRDDDDDDDDDDHRGGGGSWPIVVWGPGWSSGSGGGSFGGGGFGGGFGGGGGSFGGGFGGGGGSFGGGGASGGW